MSQLFTGTGEVIETGGGTVDTASVKKALIAAVASGDVNLGSAVGATLNYNSPGEIWERNAQDAYALLLEAYQKTSSTGIPFFISTDQHGRGLNQHRWLNNTDTDGMELLNLNLGDTCADVYSQSSMQAFHEATCKVKNYISTPGNHDYKGSSGADLDFWTTYGFHNTRDGCQIASRPNYTVIDRAHKVKVMMADFYDPRGIVSGMPHPYISTELANWVIEELSREDGCDIIFCTHEPIMATFRQRSGDYQTNPEDKGLSPLFKARKEKTSGSYVDSEGVSHAYSFKGLSGDMLVLLSGHWHKELYNDWDGVTAYSADWYGNNLTCTFGLINRIERTVTLWVFNASDKLQPLTLHI